MQIKSVQEFSASFLQLWGKTETILKLKVKSALVLKTVELKS